MRVSVAMILVVFLAGCAKKQPLTVHYRPVAYWVRALQDPDRRTRLKAARALGNVGTADPAAVPALAGAVKDADPEVRAAAVLALLRIGPDARDAVPALSTALADEDPAVRSYAAKALEKVRGGP
jgi:HEAT repeat protein